MRYHFNKKLKLEQAWLHRDGTFLQSLREQTAAFPPVLKRVPRKRSRCPSPSAIHPSCLYDRSGRRININGRPLSGSADAALNDRKWVKTPHWNAFESF